MQIIDHIDTIKIIAKRDKMLRDSDWTQLPDVDLVNKTEWKDYRKELRDITKQVGYPLSIIWPITPENIPE